MRRKPLSTSRRTGKGGRAHDPFCCAPFSALEEEEEEDLSSMLTLALPACLLPAEPAAGRTSESLVSCGRRVREWNGCVYVDG